MENNKNLVLLPNEFYLKKLALGFQPCSNRSWPRDLRKIYQQRCFITGLTNKECTLAVHHLYNRKDHSNLEFSLFNGLVLNSNIHKKFHKLFGIYTTPKQFKEFLLLYNSIYPEIPIESNKLDKLIYWVDFLDLQMNLKEEKS